MSSVSVYSWHSRSSAAELAITDYIRRSNMGRSPCCSKQGLNRGAWTEKEDMILSEYIRIHGDGKWRYLPEKAGLKRCGKSCRLRWLNYLHPDIKRGNISPYEEELIIRLHRLLGNRWSLIAGRLPGRTDSEIKNYWNCHLGKKPLSMNQSKPKSSKHNLNRRSKDPPPRQNYVYRATPVRISTAVRQSEMVKPNSGSEIGSADHAFKLSNIEETMNSSQSSCHLLVNNDSEHMAFGMADVNLVKTEVTNSPCSMWNLADQKLPHSDNFAEHAATLDGSLFDLKEISSSESDFLTDFGLEDFYSGPARLSTETNEIEYVWSEQSNMRNVNSLTFAAEQGIQECYDSTHPLLEYILN